jgi:maltooligosyltrehalose synthase
MAPDAREAIEELIGGFVEDARNEARAISAIVADYAEQVIQAGNTAEMREAAAHIIAHRIAQAGIRVEAQAVERITNITLIVIRLMAARV